MILHKRYTNVVAFGWFLFAVPYWADTALAQAVPADLAAQYGTTPSPALAAAIQSKAAATKTAAESWLEQGHDPSPALALMRQVPAAMSAGNIAQVEYLIDHAYAFLMSAPPATRQLAAGEETSDLYLDPAPIEIAGYSGQAMEPFISPDGRFLFFNNENDSGAIINLHFAARTGANSFRYMGELPGANAGRVNAAPSMDTAGHFYYTTDREYGHTLKSTYTGTFDTHRLVDVHAVAGEISANVRGTINMDVGISPDGNALYISRAVFAEDAPKEAGPKESILMVAHRRNGIFEMDPHSADIMRNINTGDLNYAPAISADGHELYFTRAQPRGTAAMGPRLRLMVATRTADNRPFDKPRVLTALGGLVEAPTVPLDLSEMFFHKRVNGRWLVYRAVRKK